MPHLIDRRLCTRCGACLAVSKNHDLQKDAQGFPVWTRAFSPQENHKYQSICSGGHWNYKELLTQQYGAAVRFDPCSPDIGHYLCVFLLTSKNASLRRNGQSGGVTTTLLGFAFDQGLIDAAVVVRRGQADAAGAFKSEPYIARSVSDLGASMGSKYTICPTLEAVGELRNDERFAATLLPCQTVGLKRLMNDWKPDLAERCRLIIGPFCGLNMEEEAGRALARAANIDSDQVSTFANRGGAFPGKTTFQLLNGDYKYVDRTAHRILYRMFAPLRCYTCTDYGNELADIVVADCWERGASGFQYPEGAAYVICRTERGRQFVENAIAGSCVQNLPVDVEARIADWRPSFYHRKVRAHNRIRYWAERAVPVPKLDYPMPPPFEDSKWADRIEMASWRIFRHRRIRDWVLKWWVGLADAPQGSLRNLMFEDAKHYLFTHTYDQFTRHNATRSLRRYLSWIKRSILSFTPSPLRTPFVVPGRGVVRLQSFARSLLRLFGFRCALRQPDIAPREAVILGGYGYGNTGDEAQLGANLARWRRVVPRTEVLVLSPEPTYTAKHHDCRSASASRTVLFQSNETSDYGCSSRWFRFVFWPTLVRMEINAQLMRAGLAPWFATSAETRFLSNLQGASVVHVSGGGFMTGPTRSRLWDTCLVLRLCRRLGTPYFLTGQTLGIFQDWADRWLAKTALRHAVGISLRDPVDSERELTALGIPAERLSSGVDDALFCDKASPNQVSDALQRSGIKPGQAFLAVNYHWWGMDAETRAASTARLASVLDALGERYPWQILFVPMVPVDEEAQRAVMAQMTRDASILVYDYAYPLVRGVIGAAQALVSFKHHPLIFAMGEHTPCLSVSFDAYYHRKNKGAMANLGQERFCLDRDGFFGARFEAMVAELVDERDQVIASLAENLHHARAAQDAFFDRVLRETGLIVEPESGAQRG